MERVNFDNIPAGLAIRTHWVLWRTASNGDRKPTKLPYRPTGNLAESDNPGSWTSLETARKAYEAMNYEGVGYMFHEGDPFCGIDLDGCRRPDTGAVAPWAKEIILALDSYAEVSPSGTGVKVWIAGKSPFDSGKKKALDFPQWCETKKPGIEIYDKLRYFAVTGWRLVGPVDPQPRDIGWLKEQFWTNDVSLPQGADFRSEPAVIDRARKYLAKLPPAISGQGGHDRAFHAACVLVLGFELPENAAYSLLCEYNATCQPPWSEKELRHKVQSALKQPGERGYLRNATPQRWDSIRVPDYEPPVKDIKITTLADASREYIARIREGGANMVDLGIADVDHALGGGVEPGEIIVIGARPSHGKSAAALQIVHQWTGDGRPCLVISEEMSRIMLGKRTLQFISDIPQEHWQTRTELLDRAVDNYEETRAPAYIVESCGTAAAACEQMESAVTNHKVELVVIDYAQLLQSSGSGEYERITKTSQMLVKTAKALGVTAIMLCQLNREIEKRNKFHPQMSDLRGSGQFEQDADVILFMVWPHRIDNKQPANEYRIYVAKNRNREIVNRVVTCRFNPSRQVITAEKPLEKAKTMTNYTQAFADWETATF